MNRDKAIAAIERKAKKILGKEDGLSGTIGDGCEVESESLWVYWPTIDGETVALFSDYIMDDDGNDGSEINLVDGWKEMQAFLEEIELQL